MRLYGNFRVWNCTEISVYGSSEVCRLRPDILGRFASGPARTFSDAAPCKRLRVSMTAFLVRYLSPILEKGFESQQDLTF